MVRNSKEFRLFGPPGTGKTTYLARQVNNACQAAGVDEIMVASFTKAAASEIAGRDTPLRPDQVGTLHAFCYRALGRPEVVEGHLKEWNEYAPQYAMTSGGQGNMDEMAVDAVFETTGDELYVQHQLLRAKMTPRTLWPMQVLSFDQMWTRFKIENGFIDFTDMIERGLEEIDEAPGAPGIGFFDEVQDFAPLELALVRKWGRKMHTILLAGDDDQAIYAFKGATPDAFLNPPLPQEQIRVLSQSWRVPAAVQRLAQAWIEKVSQRQVKDYAPKRDENGDFIEGAVRRVNVGSWRNPAPLLDDAAQYLAYGKTVMFLTTCSYMLEPIKAVLRERGLPFHNPYRRRRGDWNPLSPSRGKSAGERVLAYFRVPHDRWDPFWAPGDARDSFLWTPDDLQMWMELIKTSEVLNRGSKASIERTTGDYPQMARNLHGYFKEGVFDRAQTLDPDWLESVLLASKAKGAEFPLQVVRCLGADALTKRPQVLIGTIHSVKGGEADVVYQFPDLSRAGYEEWTKPGESHDSVRRLFYVGMTRPKDTLVLCPPASPMAVRI